MSVKLYVYIVYPSLMSVASKTKRYTAVVLGLLVALSALPTWANTSPGIEVPTVYQSVVSTQNNQDLSVLRAKLKERFSWLSEEVVSLMQWTRTSPEFSHGSVDTRVIDVRQWIVATPAKFGQDFFVDTENDPYRNYINRLASYDVLVSSSRFYPQNYFRVDDFIGLLRTLYQKKYSTALDVSAIESLVAGDTIMTKWSLQQIMMALQIDDIQIDGNSYDKLMRSEWSYYLVRMFDVPGLGSNEQSSSVHISDYFTDSVGHPFAWAINILANLAIVSSQTSNFYPDNYLRHYDFITIFVNSLLSDKSHLLESTNTSSFSDVELNAPYLWQLLYATNRGLIDDLVVSRRWQLFFEPYAFITKEQVYKVLHKAVGVEFVYDKEHARQEKITRAEMAQLIVDTLWLESKTQKSEIISSNGLDDDSLVTKLRVLLSLL